MSTTINRCLYCYQEGETHAQCAAEFWGSDTLPSEKFDTRYSDSVGGYSAQAEALVLRLASKALILTQPTTLYRDDKGEICLVQRKGIGAESIEQLAARLEGCHFDHSVEMMADLVEDFSAISRLDVVNLFEQVLFGWIMGCNTMSGSDFALLNNPGGATLSPLFNARPSLIFAQEDPTLDQFALSINGKRRGIKRNDFEVAMRYMGLKERIIRITIQKMISSKESWLSTIENSMLEEPQRKALSRLISLRLSALA